jgi:metal-sulfur cluster biosynthetic enzyme
MSNQISKEEIKTRLDDVVCPCAQSISNGYNVKEMGMVKSISLSSDGHVSIDLRLTQPACMQSKYIRREVVENVGGIDEVNAVSVDIDDGLEWRSDMMSEKTKRERRAKMDEQMEETAVRE